MRIVYMLSFCVLLLMACNGSSSTASSASSTAVSNTSNNGTFLVSDNDAPGSAKIELEVSGVQDGPTLLVGYFENQQYRQDSSFLKNGKVKFQSAEGYPQGFYFVYLPNQSSLQLLMGEDQNFKLKADASNLANSMNVQGCIDNELLYENLKFQNDLTAKFQAINQDLQQAQAGSENHTALKKQQEELVNSRKTHLDDLFNRAPQSLFTKFKRAGQNPDLRLVTKEDGSLDQAKQMEFYRAEFWDGVDFSDRRLLRTPVIFNKLKRFITELTVQTPGEITKATDELLAKAENGDRAYFKFIANWVALTYQPTKTTLMDSEAVMVHIVQNHFTPEKAFWAQPAELQGLQQRASEMAASLVGKKGPDVISTDPSGNTRSIYEMKEPYIVVYMFNPECEHCQEESPLLKAFHQQRKNEVGVFGIAIDTDDTKWRNYIQKVGLQDWVNVYDPTNRSIYAKYYVDKTPEMYVLNPERTIIGKNLKTFQLEELIKRDKASKR